MRKRIREVGTNDDVLSVTAVDRVSGERGRIAEVFFSALAIKAGTIYTTEPRDAHTGACAKLAAPSCNNFSDDLMSGNQVGKNRRKLAFHNVKIRPADATRKNFQQKHTRARLRL